MSLRIMLWIGSLAIVGVAVMAAESRVLYTISRSLPLCSPEQWDYLTYDAESGRLFIAHGSGIDVIDGASGTPLGKIAVPGANGIAVVPAIGKGYAGSRSRKAVLIFDLKTLKAIKELPADDDTDAVVYDPASQRVFVMQGAPRSITIIDTHTDAVVATLALDGQPEFAAVDGNGKLFVNITDKNEIQKIDTRTAKIDATWSISDCERPHGLAISPVDQRLFASCVNSKLLVVDSTDGKVVAALTIGKGSDAVAYDVARKRVFSSNSDGTLSVIQQDTPQHYVGLGNMPTRESARTMALNPKTGRVYLVTGEPVEIDSAATDPRKRFAIRAGSVSLLFDDPSD